MNRVHVDVDTGCFFGSGIGVSSSKLPKQLSTVCVTLNLAVKPNNISICALLYFKTFCCNFFFFVSRHEVHWTHTLCRTQVDKNRQNRT